jgi:hypothetical protein
MTSALVISKAQLEDLQLRSGLNADLVRELAAIILVGVATAPKDGAKAAEVEVPPENLQPPPGGQMQQQQQQPDAVPVELQQPQALPKPDFESDRPAASKRDRADQGEESDKAGAEHDDSAAAEGEAADHLFGDQDIGKPRQRSRSPKASHGKKLCPPAVVEVDAEKEEVNGAAELALAFSKQFPDKPTEVSTAIPAAASTSSASTGLSG